METLPPPRPGKAHTSALAIGQNGREYDANCGLGSAAEVLFPKWPERDREHPDGTSPSRIRACLDSQRGSRMRGVSAPHDQSTCSLGRLRRGERGESAGKRRIGGSGPERVSAKMSSLTPGRSVPQRRSTGGTRLALLSDRTNRNSRGPEANRALSREFTIKNSQWKTLS